MHKGQQKEQTTDTDPYEMSDIRRHLLGPPWWSSG